MSRRAVSLATGIALQCLGALALASPVRVEAIDSISGKMKTPVEVTPGYWIRLDAGGCVGEVSYLQPFRSAAQGLVSIPGVTSTFVPIGEIVNRWLQIEPALKFPTKPAIWLAYGSYGRANVERHPDPDTHGGELRPSSTAVPCSGPAKPWVSIEQVAHPELSRSGDQEPAFELALPAYDLNLLPLNPHWGTPSADACASCDGFSFRGPRNEQGLRLLPATCTSQDPYVDYGECSVGYSYCSHKGRNIKGHVNWGPATLTGRLKLKARGARPQFGYLNPDGDVEFLLEVDERRILTSANRQGGEFTGAVGLEFASYETYQYFTKGWWRTFWYKKWFKYPMPVYIGPFGFTRHVPREQLTPSSAFQNAGATVVGILGLDNEHEAHPEIHPVYALAFKSVGKKGDYFWPVFARSWGTEGSCANRAVDQRLDLSSLRIRLPDSSAPGMTLSGLLWDDEGRRQDCTIARDAEGAVLVIDLPRRPNGLVYGEIRVSRGNETENDASRPSICSETPMAELGFQGPPLLSWTPSVYSTIISP